MYGHPKLKRTTTSKVSFSTVVNNCCHRTCCTDISVSRNDNSKTHLINLISIFNFLEFKDILESATCKCLDLLVCVFEKQGIFMEHARSVGSSIILSPLDELLLSVNPKTGRPDYLFILGRYMCEFIHVFYPFFTLGYSQFFNIIKLLFFGWFCKF